MAFRNKLKIFIACMLTVLCIASAPNVLMRSMAYTSKEDAQKQLDNLDAKIKNIKSQQADITNKINQAKNEIERQQIAKKELDYQIYLTNQEIILLTQRIDLLTAQIEEQETEIAEKQQEIDNNYDLFLKRMRQMYMSSNTSTLGLLLGVDNFAEFLTRAEALKRVAEQDKNLIETLYNDKADLQSVLEEIDADKQEVEADKAALNAQKQNLASQSSAVEQQIQTLEGMERAYQANQVALQKQLSDAKKEMDDIYAKLKSEGEFVGGAWLWPVTGYKTITSYYGWRFEGTDFHTGIDISGYNIYRKDALASNAGRIQLVGYQPNGYGNYVIIDHGGGYSTLYGHLDQVLVSVGQQVKRGQAIGKVGTTGWSTGPHLHFEIRINNKHTNPLPLLNS